MLYRVCLSIQSGLIQLEDNQKWQGGQIHSEYPKISGGLGEYIADLIFNSVLGSPAPNISLVTESLSASERLDGLPKGCYASIHNNDSDISFMPVEYPVLDFSKVDPVQVIYEGPLSIISSYNISSTDEGIIIYADFLESSLDSFDILIWSLVFLSFFVFVGLLSLRRYLDPSKRNSYSPMFETFRNMIGQDRTDFEDKSGRVISFLMKLGFFLLIAYYWNLMSTDLVVVVKPQVINNYRDIMNKNLSVGFLAVMDDLKEFEKSKEKTIQHEFWKQYRNTRVMLDSSRDAFGGIEFLGKFGEGKGAIILTSFLSTFGVKAICKIISGQPAGNHTFARMSHDPEGKQHTMGIVLRRGIYDSKAHRRLRGLFEGNVIWEAVAKGSESFELGPMVQAGSISKIMKCMSKSVNYNQHEIEQANLQNFRYLFVVFFVMLIIAFAILFLENVTKFIIKIKRVRPI